jgi:hypothetical protein
VSGDAVAALMVDWFCWVGGSSFLLQAFLPRWFWFFVVSALSLSPLCLTLFPWDIHQIALSLSLSCSLSFSRCDFGGGDDDGGRLCFGWAKGGGEPGEVEGVIYGGFSRILLCLAGCSTPRFAID